LVAGKIAWNRFIEHAMWPYCAHGMNDIVIGGIMYANSHGGQFPDDLVSLFDTQEIGSGEWYCIAANHGVGVSPDFQGARADIQSGNISYIWLGKGVTVSSLNDVVVLYEKPENHSGRGMNVAFADAHIEWLGPGDMKALLQQIATGERPIHFHSTVNSTTNP